jgi:hypothetical protein
LQAETEKMIQIKTTSACAISDFGSDVYIFIAGGKNRVLSHKTENLVFGAIQK